MTHSPRSLDEVVNENFDMLLKGELQLVDFKSVTDGTEDTNTVISGSHHSKEIPTPVKSAALTLQQLAKLDEVKYWEKDHTTGRSDQSNMH